MPKILGVDDSATMRRILEMTFAGDPGSQVTTVPDGDAAVRWAGENGPDIVLADTSMSGTDGYEVARALRASAATQGVAVIVLASQHHPYDAEKGRQCGVDDHVMKPFETQALIDKVRDVLGRARPAAAARPVAAAPSAGAPSAGPAVPAPPAAPARPTAVGPGGPPRPPSPGTPGVVGAPAARPAAAPISGGISAGGVSAAAARSTVAFGAPPGARPPAATPAAPSSTPAAAARPAQVAAPAAAAKKPSLELADEDEAVTRAAPVPQISRPAPAAAVAATSANGEMAGKLSGMGLTPEQVDGVLALSREVIERVVWEVVPDLAETIIREEIRRLTSG